MLAVNGSQPIVTSRSRTANWLVLAVLVALVACDDTSLQTAPDPVETRIPEGDVSGMVGAKGELVPRPEPKEFISALKIDMPAERRAFEANDAALIAAVEATKGLVFIGLKPVDAARTSQTGIIPAMTKSQVLEAHRTIEAAGAMIRRSFVSIPAVLAELAPEAAVELRKLPTVNYVEPAESGTIAVAYLPQQDTSWGVFKVRAPQAWHDNRGHGATITILDTGVDLQHVTSGDGPVRLYADCLTAGFPSCFDDNGHGSHVAGIAAARDDGQGYIGIMHYEGPIGPSLASVKVCDSGGYCPAGSVVGGLDWTATNGRPRQIVNMSFSQPHSTTLAAVVAASYNAGNLLVAAAGNNSDKALVNYPAQYSQVIAVSGTLPSDAAAGWITCPNEYSPYQTRSNFGPEVELSAPFYATSMWLNGTYQTHCGTSMAAPVVSGTAALVWTKYPSWTNSQVRARLQSTAKDLGTTGRDPYFGYGRVDAGAAVGISIPSVTISGPTWITSAGNYTWTANPSGGVGGYTYEWYRKTDYWWPRGSATCHYETPWRLVGTGKTYSSFESTFGYDFRLQVVVRSGGESASRSTLVTVGDGSIQCPM